MKYLKAKEYFELYFILTALNRHEWKVLTAATDLGLSKQGIYKIIKKHKLRPGFKPPSPSSFLISGGLKQKPIRRIILFEPLDIAWLKSKSHLGSYSQLLRAAIKTLRKMTDSKIQKLCD